MGVPKLRGGGLFRSLHCVQISVHFPQLFLGFSHFVFFSFQLMGERLHLMMRVDDNDGDEKQLHGW